MWRNFFNFFPSKFGPFLPKEREYYDKILPFKFLFFAFWAIKTLFGPHMVYLVTILPLYLHGGPTSVM